MLTILTIGGLLLLVAAAWFGPRLIRRIGDAWVQQPYEPDRRYVVTQPGTNPSCAETRTRSITRPPGNST